MNQQLPAPQVEEIHLRDYLNVIRRRRRTFVVSFLAVMLAVVLYTFSKPALYESTATLFVKDDKEKASQIDDLLANAAAPVDAELEILKSRSNAEKVVTTLHLDWKVDKRSHGVDFKAVEFSSNDREPVYSVQLLGGGSYQVKDEDGELVGTGMSGEFMRGKRVTLLLKDLKGKKGDTFRITLLPFHQVVQDLRQQIRAAEVGKKTNVISVAYRNEDPLLAREVVNTLVHAYLDQGIAIKSEEATRTLSFVEEQLQGLRVELDSSEKNLESYKSSSGVIQLDAEAQNLLQTLTDAEKQKVEATLQRKQVEFALTSLKDARKRGAVYSPAVLRDDPLVAGLASRLAELEVQKRGLLSDSTENHPSVKGVQAQIDEVQKQIQATYETSLKGMGKQEDNISREITRNDAQLKKLPAAERDLARLTRLSKVNADIYSFLLQKHEEARIAKASTISSINVVDSAIAAEKPIAPNKKKNLLLGLIVGVMAGVGLCLFREYLDDTLKDPEQMKSTLEMPILALIPYIQAKESEVAMLSHDSPRQPASEAFRALRTGLHFGAMKKERQAMLVTSTLPGEGKSTVASNLAISLADTGARVLIVDCDLRRSTLHEKFGHPTGKGLSELLAGEISLAKAIQATKVVRLDLMQAGAHPPNPVLLLESAAMVSFIEKAREIYSYIILDAPPMLLVTDAAVLTQVSDLVILVLEPGRVPTKAALRIREVLTATATPVAGIVISEKNPRSADYGYAYGYQSYAEPAKRPWWHWS